MIAFSGELGGRGKLGGEVDDVNDSHWWSNRDSPTLARITKNNIEPKQTVLIDL
jgi:hypothetical protein